MSDETWGTIPFGLTAKGEARLAELRSENPERQRLIREIVRLQDEDETTKVEVEQLREALHDVSRKFTLADDDLRRLRAASAAVVAAWGAWIRDESEDDDTTYCALRDAVEALSDMTALPSEGNR